MEKRIDDLFEKLGTKKVEEIIQRVLAKNLNGPKVLLEKETKKPSDKEGFFIYYA